ncbi:MAG: 16S rRNA (uracil(1498)-N(3))-methyltransferase [Bdellovibrionales bacterium]
MAQHIARLWVSESIKAGAILPIADADRVHHLRDVLRLKTGDSVLVFNGTDGEWRASAAAVTKQSITLNIESQTQPAPAADTPRVHLAFAPLKRAATEWLVEKATELGAAQLTPVITDHTQVRTLNADRLQAIAVDAVEQCGGFTPPQLDACVPLKNFLQAWPVDTPLYAALETERDTAPVFAPDRSRDIAILIGPEGGWSDDEIALLKQHAAVKPISLGRRILRAETAALAACAIAKTGN